MITICFVNQKGGVGKTASVVNIGAGFAKLGKKVLAIDLDPQESLSYWLGITEPPRTIYDFFADRAELTACIVNRRDGFDVIPSSEMLATTTPSVSRLRHALETINYDFVLLDCSPTLGMTTLAALSAANWVIIPFCPDLLSIKGMSQLLGTIAAVRARTNPALLTKAVIATRYSYRKKMHRDVLEQVADFFAGTPVYTVRENIAVAESPVEGMSVLDYKPNSNGATDYLAIARALIDV